MLHILYAILIKMVSKGRVTLPRNYVSELYEAILQLWLTRLLGN